MRAIVAGVLGMTSHAKHANGSFIDLVDHAIDRVFVGPVHAKVLDQGGESGFQVLNAGDADREWRGGRAGRIEEPIICFPIEGCRRRAISISLVKLCKVVAGDNLDVRDQKTPRPVERCGEHQRYWPAR